jgi:hypothetical protein
VKKKHLYRSLPLFFCALLLCLTAVLAPLAHADEPQQPQASYFGVTPPSPGLDSHFARITRNLPIYTSLENAQAGRVSWWLRGWDSWVSVIQGAQVNGQTYYQTSYGWVPGDRLAFAPVTTLRGVELQAYAGQRLARLYWPQAEVRAAPDNNALVVAMVEDYALIQILGEQWTGNELWYQIGADSWIKRLQVRHLAPGARPARIPATDRWIEVNLSEQMVFAHEGDTPVYAALIASGKPPRWPTAQGLFRIWGKFEKDRMQGGATAADYYDLANVPWTMYFYQGYALHAAYWHDAFGEPRSHGCVNLSPIDAQWFFNWAGPVMPEGANSVRSSAQNPGTWVWVHN